MRHPVSTLLAALLALSASAAGAAGPTQHPYRATMAERQDCATDAATYDRANCRREGAAARAEAARGGLTSPDAETLMRNALARCQVHRDSEERRLCERLVRGDGTRSGSVAGGGVIRELVTVEPAS
ncbi:MAG: hypothetical protein QM750_06025 [Rubrivivax sp.]